MNMLKSSPDQLAMLRQNNPKLAEAMDKGLEEFTKVKLKYQVDSVYLRGFCKMCFLADFTWFLTIYCSWELAINI